MFIVRHDVENLWEENEKRFDPIQQQCADWLANWVEKSEGNAHIHPAVVRIVEALIFDFDRTFYDRPNLEGALKNFERSIETSDEEIKEELQVVYDAMRETVGV